MNLAYLARRSAPPLFLAFQRCGLPVSAGDLDMPPLLPKPSDCNTCVGKPRLVQREDDTEAVVRDRLVIYSKQTSPLIDYYTRQGKLFDFAVKRGIDDVPRLAKVLGIN